MCIGCGGWSIFREDLSLRKPTDAEWEELAGLPEVQRVSSAWAHAQQCN